MVAKKMFVMNHVFTRVNTMNEMEERYSESEKHYNIGWRLRVIRTSRLKLLLFAELDENQNVLAVFKLTIIAPNGNMLSCGYVTAPFRTGLTIEWDLGKWSNAINDCLWNYCDLKVEARVRVLEMTGFPRKVLRSFGKDVKQFSDVALVVDNKKFYVSKLFLSSQSEFFATLFLGPFQETGKPEVQLKEINPEALQCFLEAIYGEPAALDDDTIEGILSIADMYNTPTVVKKCEKFLIEKSEKKMMKKLQLAGKYKLDELKKFCMEQIRTAADICSVTPEDPIEMDPAIVASLLQKFLTLV